MAGHRDPQFAFLPDGGETGALVRSTDWSKTAIGPVSAWPEALKTTLGILFHSKSPMYLMWGPELIGFYNDAFRNSLDAGKHPAGMGMPAQELWKEAWSIVGPEIQATWSRGEASWHEDQPIPNYRNGRLETACWTYSYSPVYLPDGSIGGVFTSCLETTDRTLEHQAMDKAQIAQVESERANFRALFEEAPEFFCVISGPDLRFEYVNPAHRAIFGGQDLTGMTVPEAQPELAASGFTDLLYGVLRTGEAAIVRESPAAIREEEHFFDLIYAPRRNAKGEVDGILALGMDVTDRVQARLRVERLLAELRETSINDRRFRASFAHAQVGLVIANLECKIVEINSAFATMLGRTQQSLLGASFVEITHPDHLKADVANIELLLRRDVPSFVSEKRYLCANGESVWARSSVSLTMDEHGQPSQILVIIQNIDELKRAEEALREAIRARDEFLSIASHELKTPLTSIRLQTQLTQRQMAARGLDPERVKSMLDQTDRSVMRLTRLVDDMLDISRISTGRLSITLEQIDLADLVRDVAERLNPEAETAGIRFSLETEARIPLLGDYFRIDQVLTNLILNAFRYGAGTPVSVIARRENGVATIEVRDEGPGIAPEHQSRIFERFERAISSKSISGMGLGLYISREIVQRHGGTLEIESQPEQGATFRIRLPNQSAIQPAHQAQGSQAAAGSR